MPMTDPPRPTGSLGYDGTAINTPRAKIVEIAIDDVDVPEEMRTIDEDTVQRIIESIAEIGLQAQGVITVEWNPAGSPRRIRRRGPPPAGSIPAPGMVNCPGRDF